MKNKNIQIVSIGMAMFSMFFGAGNVIFPLLVGQATTDMSFWAMLGLIITAVGVPFTGLFAMTLYNGNAQEFFSRIGKWPSFLVALLIMGCIGPFGGIPRCIGVAYATTNMFFSVGAIAAFSIAACIAIYFAALSKNRVMDIIGWVLTPFFLLSIGFIIVMGIVNSPFSFEPSTLSAFDATVYGLKEGYNTMDLLGSFFFGAVVIQALKNISTVDGKVEQKLLVKNGLLSCLVGAVLMTVVYVGMSSVAAYNSVGLAGIKPELLIGTIALDVLGPYAGITTCIAVIIATLTTAIALASVTSEFFSSQCCNGRISYKTALIATLVTTFFVSTLEFSGIVRMLSPIVQTIYPVLLILSIVNIAYKLWGFDAVKTPVAGAITLALIAAM